MAAKAVSWAVFGLALGCVVLQARGAEGVAVPERVVEAPAQSASPPVRLNLVRLDAMNTVVTVALPSADEELGAATAEDPGIGPLRIGVHRVPPDQHRGDIVPRLRWVTDPEDGSASAAVAVASPNALRIRLGIRARLPRGAEIRFFHGSPPTVVGTMSPRDFASEEASRSGPQDSVRWSPSVPGDTLGMEITLPSTDAQYETQLEIHRVSHHSRPARPTGAPANSSRLECSHVDVLCRDVGNKLNAVARIAIEKARGPVSCSGTLVNNADGTSRLYFLTANHCVSTPSEARDLEAHWYWQSDSCGSTTTDPEYHVASDGADWLATSVAQDTTLVELKSRPPARVLFSAWSSIPRGAGVEVYGIHHPGGEHKKYLGGTTGDAVDSEICGDDGCYTVERSIPVTITDGAGERGSSGSGLFDGVRLIGVLAGGDGCHAATYGRFSDFLPRVQRWLAPGPDLVVESLEVDPANVDAGASLRLTALVRNRGTRTADRTTLTYYRSSNSTISSGDTPVGTDRISRLDAGKTDGERIDLTAPNSPGTYYYGACVDDVPNESIRSNNCSAGVRVTVELDCGRDDHADLRHAATLIDLDVDVDGVICPHDDVDWFRFEIPSRGEISVVVEDTSSDWEVGVVVEDEAGRTIDIHHYDVEPVDAGTYYVKVRDATFDDYDEDPTNNGGPYTLRIGHMPVDDPSSAPDLVVESPEVDQTTVEAGAPFTLAARVRNRGGGTANVTTLRYYRSTTRTISTEDTAVGTDAVGQLAADTSSTESIRLTAPDVAGTYYYGACVDAVAGESARSNNCSNGVPITVEESSGQTPDLVVEAVEVDAAAVNAGDIFTMAARVRNRGEGPADATTLRYHRSANATITTDDTVVGADYVGQLAAEASSSAYTRLTAPDQSGTYYYGACVDVVDNESDLTNNCSDGVRLVVTNGAGGSYYYAIPYFPAASDPLSRQGFARVVNHAGLPGTLEIEAVDDAGNRSQPLTLPIGAGQTRHFNSDDLEYGNAAKGLTRGTGSGQGGWRLEITGDVDFEALSYIRTPEGFLTAMHDTAPFLSAFQAAIFDVPTFNPGSNRNQESLLRLVNWGRTDASVVVTATDDAGVRGGDVSTEVPAGQSRTYTAEELESGAAPGLRGSLGDGTGKWRLSVEATTEQMQVMGLLSSPTGHLTNLSTAPYNVRDGVHAVPLFPSASDPHGRQGFVRVLNASDRAGTVSIQPFDDTDRAYGALTLAIGPGEAKHFNSADLEDGNPGKGLVGSTGSGRGDWRLELESDLRIGVLAYVRTDDGLLTAMHDIAPVAGKRYRIAVFNPGSNAAQRSLLRLVNRSGEPVAVSITGTDDDGVSPGDGVLLTVPARASRTLTALELESGNPEFEGSLGDGRGKWALTVATEVPVSALSLLASPTGHLTNLSTAPVRGAGETVDAMFDIDVAPIIQDRCVNCHVRGGESGDTRLVFVLDTDPEHAERNLAVFEDLLVEVEQGVDLVLDKVQGIDHGGGVQVAPGTADFAGIERFLKALRAEVRVGRPP